MVELTDHQRVLLVGLVLAKLAREGCDADPAYTGLLRKLSGVDVVVRVYRPGDEAEPVS